MENLDVLKIVTSALRAGEKILTVYQSNDFNVENKEDNSPLTKADRESNESITKDLRNFYPTIPILSEEGKHVSYAERKKWTYYWLVDPLDGTKEFIKRNGEFTVNIGLIHKGQPILGVVYAPVLGTLYFSKRDVGSFKMETVTGQVFHTERELINAATKLPLANKRDQLTAVASRSHRSKETEAYLNGLRNSAREVDIVSVGSSLKLCFVAEGTADVYPRFTPTMEWDTGAGHAIISEAGGKVTNVNLDKPLTYNKANLRNPWFIATMHGFQTE